MEFLLAQDWFPKRKVFVGVISYVLTTVLLALTNFDVQDPFIGIEDITWGQAIAGFAAFVSAYIVPEEAAIDVHTRDEPPDTPTPLP